MNSISKLTVPKLRDDLNSALSDLDTSRIDRSVRHDVFLEATD